MIPTLVLLLNVVWETSTVLKIAYWWCLLPNIGGASDWPCQVGNLLQPTRSTTKVWVVTHHQHGISALIFSDNIFQGNQWWYCKMLAVFSGNCSMNQLQLTIAFSKWEKQVTVLCQQCINVVNLFLLRNNIDYILWGNFCLLSIVNMIVGCTWILNMLIFSRFIRLTQIILGINMLYSLLMISKL